MPSGVLWKLLCAILIGLSIAAVHYISIAGVELSAPVTYGTGQPSKGADALGLGLLALVLELTIVLIVLVDRKLALQQLICKLSEYDMQKKALSDNELNAVTIDCDSDALQEPGDEESVSVSASASVSIPVSIDRELLAGRTEPGKTLRILMAKMDMNTTELAAKTGLSLATISNLRTGKITRPQPLTAQLISAALGVDRQVIWPDETFGSPPSGSRVNM